MTLRRIFSALLALTPAISLATSAVVAHADGAGDNSTQNVRHIPPTGVTVGDADRTDLQTGLDSLQKAIAELKALSAGVVIVHEEVSSGNHGSGGVGDGAGKRSANDLGAGRQSEGEEEDREKAKAFHGTPERGACLRVLAAGSCD